MDRMTDTYHDYDDNGYNFQSQNDGYQNNGYPPHASEGFTDYPPENRGYFGDERDTGYQYGGGGEGGGGEGGGYHFGEEEGYRYGGEEGMGGGFGREEMGRGFGGEGMGGGFEREESFLRERESVVPFERDSVSMGRGGGGGEQEGEVMGDGEVKSFVQVCCEMVRKREELEDMGGGGGGEGGVSWENKSDFNLLLRDYVGICEKAKKEVEGRGGGERKKKVLEQERQTWLLLEWMEWMHDYLFESEGLFNDHTNNSMETSFDENTNNNTTINNNKRKYLSKGNGRIYCSLLGFAQDDEAPIPCYSPKVGLTSSMAVIFGVKRWLECIWGEDVADTRSADYIQTAGRHRGELIHPDWAGGMGRGLVGEDVDNENRLVRDLWSCVRRGDLPTAYSLCIAKEQPWRAATLAGVISLYLLSDPYCPLDEEVIMREVGDDELVKLGRKRKLWKETCRNITKKSTYADREKALYGVLSGVPSVALSSSPSWHDRLWLEVSHFVLKMSDLSFSEAEGGVRKKVEGGRGVRRGRRGVGGESMISSTSFLGNSIVGGGSIGNVSSVSSLSVLSSSSSTFSSSSPSSAEFLGANIGDILGELGRDFDEDKMDPFLVMQKKIMMGNFDELVNDLFRWTKLRTCPLSGRRFACHLVLYLKNHPHTSFSSSSSFSSSLWPKMNNTEEQLDEIIGQYIKELVSTTKFYGAIAFYTSTLSPSRQVKEYGDFLLRIDEGEERREAMENAEAAGLDTDKIIQYVVQNTQQRNMGSADHEDHVKINSLSWFEYLERHKSLEFKEANRLIREFLLAEKLDLADKILSREVLMDRAREEGGEEEGEGELKEFLFFRFLVQGFSSYFEWVNLCENPPAVPPSVSSSSSSSFVHPRFKEPTVSHRETQARYEKQYHSWQERKNSFQERAVDNLQSSARSIIMTINEIIEYLEDHHQEEEEERKQRREELEEVQSIYIPKIIFFLHDLFLGGEMWEKGVELINFVTENGLLEYFSREDAKILMEKMRMSAMRSLEAGVDPSQIP